MGVNCEFRFDHNPRNIVFSGQTLTGIIELATFDIINVRRAYLNFEGHAECQWKQRDERNLQKHSEHDQVLFYGKEHYLDIITEIIPCEMDIAPGKHTYNFMVVLPSDLPSSVIQREGHIKYHARVVFDRIWKQNLVFSYEFTVLRPIDLNIKPILEVPKHQEEYIDFCCLWCSKKPIKFSANLPISGYVVGQTLAVKVLVENPSNVEVYQINTYLMKTVTYRSQIPYEKSRSETTVIHKMYTEKSCKNGKHEYDIQFKIPNVPHSTDNIYIKILNINYEVKIKPKVRGCHTDPHFRFPITIGAIPIRGYEQDVTMEPGNLMQLYYMRAHQSQSMDPNNPYSNQPHNSFSNYFLPYPGNSPNLDSGSNQSFDEQNQNHQIPLNSHHQQLQNGHHHDENNNHMNGANPPHSYPYTPIVTHQNYPMIPQNYQIPQQNYNNGAAAAPNEYEEPVVPESYRNTAPTNYNANQNSSNNY